MDTRMICRNIEAVRLFCEISEKEMATVCGCTVSTYRYIQNDHFPRGDGEDVLLYCFCSHFRIHILDLLSPLTKAHCEAAKRVHLGESDHGILTDRSIESVKA